MGRRRSQRRAGRRTGEPPRLALWPRLAAPLAATLAVKLIVLAQLQAHPLLQPDVGLDTTSYVQLAHRVAGGDITLGPGLYYLSPLYIYFLAAALALSDSFAFVRVL
jgi:hypothetical protein